MSSSEYAGFGLEMQGTLCGATWMRRADVFAAEWWRCDEVKVG